MAKSIKSALTKYPQSLEKQELEMEIHKLYMKIPEVKKFYEVELSGDTTRIVEDYKLKIRKEYFPARGFGKARNSVSKKYITEFKRISIFPKDLVDLLLYRTEMMLEYTFAYGDIDEPFYNSLASSFEEACKLIVKERLQEDYKAYCKRLMNKASSFGWNVYDDLSYSYSTYLEEQL